uniref:Uncharacterized protein n=1 Tax=Steinernema glaseri TaxID=37863 RepID=A0A1I7YPN1_9BILA
MQVNSKRCLVLTCSSTGSRNHLTLTPLPELSVSNFDDKSYVPEPNTPCGNLSCLSLSFTPRRRAYFNTPGSTHRDLNVSSFLGITPLKRLQSFDEDRTKTCERRFPEPSFVDEGIEEEMRVVWNRIIEKNTTSKAYIRCVEDLLATAKPKKDDISVAKHMVQKNRELTAEIEQLLAEYKALKMASDVDGDL